MAWPEDWGARVSGEACPMCTEGRPEDGVHGLRVRATPWVDVTLPREAPQRGYLLVIWRRRHVVDPIELGPDEVVLYWDEVLRAGRAVHARFRPRKVNYQTLGNRVPHLHTHVTARYAEDDANPGRPLSWSGLQAIDPGVHAADAEAVQELLARQR